MEAASDYPVGDLGRVNAQYWADVLIAGLDPDVRDALSKDPRAALREHLHLKVRATDQAPRRGDQGTCDGISILNKGTVIYVPTPESRRENFTMLHEGGHHLASKNDDLLDWVADQRDQKETMRVLEEVCDRFAAGLLLPPGLIDGILDGHRPAASHFVELFKQSSASREVCAIALSKRLGCEGFVALISRNRWQVMFASRVADTRPYAWRDDEIPATHPLRTLAVGSSGRFEGWWDAPGGDRREYYVDAISDDRHIYAIFSDDDLWKIAKFHGRATSSIRSGGLYTAEVHCRSCGFQGITHQFPCSTCGKPHCPQCKKCECEHRERNLVVCSGCFIKVPRRTVVDGLCTDCQRKRKTRR